MIHRLIAWAIRRRTAVLFLVAALVAAGTWALRTLRVDAFPDLTDVQVNVLTEAPGLTPLEVERLVTYPLEVSLNGIPRVTQVRSLSRYGLSSITVVFEDGVDIYFARTQVTERVQAARSGLPPTVDVELGPLSGAIGELYQYTVEGGGLDIMQLRTLQDRIVKPQLRSVPGVVEVNAFGGIVRQVQVTVSPEKLAAYGLTLRDVVEAVEANSSVAAGGYLEHGDEQYILRGVGQPTGPDDVRRTVIRTGGGGVPVTVGDVADVDYGPEVRQGAVTRDGRGEVVAGIVMALRGVNSRELMTRIRRQVEEVNRALPPGVKVVPYYDQTDLVEGTLRTVRTNLLEGGFLVIAILLLFLGNVRAALIVAATIPLSLLFAFLGMRWLGLSANLMSLGAIDFGMIVDGSVVMGEHFVRRLHEDEERGDLPSDQAELSRRLMAAAHEVGRPIGFGVLIIMLVYVPIMTLQGLEARMFRPMALTVAMALFGSLLLALAFIPAAATLVFRKGARESRFAVRLAAWIDSRYAPLLERTMARPKLTLAVALGVFVAALLLVPRLGTEFLPEIDEGSLMIEALRDPSVSLTRSVAMEQDVERVARMTPEVTTVLSQIGRPEVASDPMGVDRGEVFVMLKPRSKWRPGFTKDDIQGEIERRLAEHVPGIAIRMTQPMAMRLDELVSGVRADLAVKVFGDDPAENRRVAEQVAAVVGRVPGASEVQVEATEGQSYLEVRLHRDAMARYGIPMAVAQQVLQSAVSRTPVSQVVDGNYTLNVVVQYPEALRASSQALGAITVPGGGCPSETGGCARIPLSLIADIRLEPGPVLMRRERGQRLVVVQANVQGRDLGGFVADVKRAVGGGVRLPTGVFLTYGGEFENQERAMGRLKLVVPLSVALIALLLYVSLSSWGLALLVLSNLPFAAVGGITALWLRGLHLSVSASIGFIALFGVAVLNGLVLLTTVQRSRETGATARHAALEGSRQRLRPVLMTALVASIGFIPVALSHGTGAEVQRPLATVVIGGLVTSTLLTLFVLPTLYAWVERRKDCRDGRDGRDGRISNIPTDHGQKDREALTT
ncbi:MAG: CusA/CzcA family heavy metal efflux RND transporter [Gemmatimonadaceae bacterium]